MDNEIEKKADEITALLIEEAEEEGQHQLDPTELRQQVLEELSLEQELFARGYGLLLEAMAKEHGEDSTAINPLTAGSKGFIKI